MSFSSSKGVTLGGCGRPDGVLVKVKGVVVSQSQRRVGNELDEHPGFQESKDL